MITLRLLMQRFSHVNRHKLLSQMMAVVGSTDSNLIDGRQHATDIQSELKIQIGAWLESNATHRPPSLVAILIGDDPASHTYVRLKMAAAQKVGINSRTINLSPTISESEIIDEIRKLNQDKMVDGVLVQLPLPSHVNERHVCDAVDPCKDVDGFHANNIGLVALNRSAFIPCTVLAVLELLKRSNVELFGKNVMICGRSKNIGLPLAMLLHSDARNELPGLEATVILCHRNTPRQDLERYGRQADVIITATGVVNLITTDMVKPGACIIDVGINQIETTDGKKRLVGDVDFENVKKVAGKITPVPGGVGPMTIAMLMKNTFEAAKTSMQ